MPPRPQQIKPNSQATQIVQRKQSILNRIEDIEFSLDDPIQILTYGRSGTGKTRLWGTFPKPILAMVCSGGMRSGELRSVATKENIGQIKPLRIKDSSDVTELCAELRKECPYNTIVLDHASGLQDLILKEVLGLEEIPVAKYKRAGKGESWGLAGKQDYGQMAIQFKEIVREVLNLPANIYIVAQEREFKSDEEQEIISPHVGAALTPAIAGWLHSSVDYIVNTFIRQKMKEISVKVAGKPQSQLVRDIGKVEYCLRTSPASNTSYITKFRMPDGNELPVDIVNPTYEKILAIIQGDSTPSE